MGRESFKGRYRKSDREYTGCISGVLHLFDFNQALSNRKLLQDTRVRDGLEAPRNSLDVPGETMEFRRSSEVELEDIPFGIEFPKNKNSKTKQEDAPRKSLKDFFPENEPKKRTPNVVARLMGLELMPDELVPVSGDQSRRNSVSGKPYSSIFTNRQQEDVTQNLEVPLKTPSVRASQNAQKSQSFRENPRQKLLEEFKREFEERHAVQLRERRSQYFEQGERNVRSASKHVQAAGPFFPSEKSVEPKPADAGRERQNQSRRFLDAMHFLKRNKDFFLNVLQDSISSERNSTETKERNPARSAESAKLSKKVSVLHRRSKPALVDEVRPSCSRNFDKSKNPPLNNLDKIRSTPLPSKIVLLKPTSENPRISRSTEEIPLKVSKNEIKQRSSSNLHGNEMKLFKYSRNSREMAREFVKQAKETSVQKFSSEISANQDFSHSLGSNFRRSVHRMESIAGSAEQNLPTAKILPRQSGGLSPKLLISSPRLANSPRFNKSTEEINNITSKEEKSKSESSSQGNSISPRLRVFSHGKYKVEERIKTERFVTRNGIKGKEDCHSPRMLPRSSSVPTAKRDLQARVSSCSRFTSKKSIHSEKTSAFKTNDATMSPKKMTNNSIDNFGTNIANVESVTNPLVARANAASETIRAALTRLHWTDTLEGQKPERRESLCNYSTVSSHHRTDFTSGFSYNMNGSARQRSEESSFSKDKTSNAVHKWPCGEAGHGISDGKCEHPSPVSVLDGLFQEDIPSPMDLKETATDLQELRTKLCLVDLNIEDSCDSDQDGKAPFQSNLIAKGKDLRPYFLHLQKGNFESLRTDDIICPEKSKSDLLYVRNVLVFAGFDNHNIAAFTRWYSPSHPVNPQIFHQLEEYYTDLKLSAENQTMKSSSNRKLNFDLIDEILCHKVKSFWNIHPWVKPKKQNLCCMYTGKQLLDAVWTEICRFPQADCKTLEDVESLVKWDLTNIGEAASATDEDVLKIGFDFEQNIFNSLVEEAVVDLFFSQ